MVVGDEEELREGARAFDVRRDEAWGDKEEFWKAALQLQTLKRSAAEQIWGCSQSATNKTVDSKPERQWKDGWKAET